MARRSRAEGPKTEATRRTRKAAKAVSAAAPAGEAAPDVATAVRDLHALAARLTESCESLAQSLAETPKAADFEPLAEHLYALATNAPRLLESLQEIPKVAAPIEESVRALREISETLQFAHESFAESLLKLPRAEDYEPLAGPLREFARVAPLLAASLAEVLRVASPLGDSVRGLREIAAELRATQAAMAAAPARGCEDPRASEATAEPLRAVAEQVESARRAIAEALETLPQEPSYAALAGQLRELATVSPSLMDWLAQVSTVTLPLGESVRGLQDAAASLAAGKEKLDALIAGLETPRPAAPGARTR